MGQLMATAVKIGITCDADKSIISRIKSLVTENRHLQYGLMNSCFHSGGDDGDDNDNDDNDNDNDDDDDHDHDNDDDDDDNDHDDDDDDDDGSLFPVGVVVFCSSVHLLSCSNFSSVRCFQRV